MTGRFPKECNTKRLSTWRTEIITELSSSFAFVFKTIFEHENWWASRTAACGLGPEVVCELSEVRQVLPLVKKYNAAVVAISNDETGISEDPDERFAVAKFPS